MKILDCSFSDKFVYYRLTCVCISGTMRIYPTASLEVILHIQMLAKPYASEKYCIQT